VKIQDQKISNLLTLSFSQINERFPFLHYIVLIHFAFLALTLACMLIDDRTLMGINVWIKPTKFIISTIIVLWTMAWYFMAYPFKHRTATGLSIAAALLLLIENVFISIQAWRGVLSHYNLNTAFDSSIFAIMGIAIGLFTLIAFWLFIKSFSAKLEFSTAMKWSFRIGWFTFLYASTVGGSMIGQSAHNVGVADGGNGIPFLNWSTEGGDLRVAHFFGLHAIQVIPLATYFISRRIQEKGLMTILSLTFAVLYLAWIIFTFHQAKAGQAFF